MTSDINRDGAFPKMLGLQLGFWTHFFHATPIGLMLISRNVGVAPATPIYIKPPPLGPCHPQSSRKWSKIKEKKIGVGRLWERGSDALPNPHTHTHTNRGDAAGYSLLSCVCVILYVVILWNVFYPRCISNPLIKCMPLRICSPNTKYRRPNTWSLLR